ncbi:MAG: hypothetical protein HKO10_00455 [Acidimicrobiia bacterium]|nr:hypothetical protein [Acidimicrobiia bacterium]
MTALELAAQQLSRMRGMNAMYHRQFFTDIFRTTVVGLVLFGVGFWGIQAAFLAVPFVALIGAAQTAFDASYLIFSRHYSHALEGFINREIGSELLVAHKMEETYLFPLDTTKIVTIPLDRAPTWFGFMTFFYTVVGVYSYVAGLTFGWNFLTLSGWEVRYGLSLGVLTVATLAMGVWWFASGAGERRLRAVLDETFER